MGQYKCVKATVGAVCIQKLDQDQRSTQGRVLLALRNHEPFFDHWCIPGGHIDFGETPEQAIIREIAEETGLDTIEYSFLRHYNEYYPKRDWHAVALVFTATVSGQLKRQESEVKKLEWFSLEEALQLNLAFTHKQVLLDYKNSL